MLFRSGELPEAPIKFTGPLSRMKKIGSIRNEKILVILSGPEPQRSILENMIMEDATENKISLILVRGLPGQVKNKLSFPPFLEVYDHLNAVELENKIAEAAFVISRCGYSTVMDLAIMQKKSILIPTPGQTEQEYLAGHLMDNNYALCISQEKFRLKPSIDLAKNFLYKPMPSSNADLLDQSIKEFIAIILKQRSRNK